MSFLSHYTQLRKVKVMKTNTDVLYLQQAIDRAVQSASNGGGPFGATLAGYSEERRKFFVFTDNNHVTENNDPTAHAEVSVIRSASKYLQTFDLSEFTLYSSCEPCPMCLSSALWARVKRVVFAADRYDAASAGFDDLAFYEKLKIDTTGLEFIEQLPMETALAPFQAWERNLEKVEY